MTIPKHIADKRDKLAEEYSFSKGVAHTKRTEPAWHYSQLDFKQGFDAAVKLLSEAAPEFIMDMRGDEKYIAGAKHQHEELSALIAARDAEINKWEAMALELGEDSRRILEWFKLLRDDHNEKLGKGLEEACKNWGNILQKPLSFSPTIKALAKLEELK